MAPNKHGDRFKSLLGIDAEQHLGDSTSYDDGLYIEPEASTKEFLLELVPTLPGVLKYLKDLFPFLDWIFHYNLTWALGDFIAGEWR